MTKKNSSSPEETSVREGSSIPVLSSPSNKLSVDSGEGLNSDEVQKRLKEFGYNEVPEKKVNSFHEFAKRFWGITPWMLEFTIALEWLLGRYFGMYIIAGLLVFNAVLGFVQEERANSALELLKRRLDVNVRVKRDGTWVVISARELVVGDVIRLRAGGLIPADTKVLSGSAEVDQSSLTGESQAVEKQANDILYSGSIIGRGEISGIVVSTGTRTYFGRTVELVQVAKPKLHMEDVTSKVVKSLIAIVGSFLLISIVVSILRGLNMLEILPLAAVLLISAIPVALPTMFTVSMALGSLDMMKKGILVTRLSASEDAATTDVICVDKTGTITMNKLQVTETVPAKGYKNKDVIFFGALASNGANQDSLDLAFLTAANDMRIQLEGCLQEKFVPFDSSTRRTEATIYMKGERCCAFKGAVKTIFSLCKMSREESSQIWNEVERLSNKGYRVIAVAEGETYSDIKLVGLAALHDKLRPDSSKLITRLKEVGISVKMLTGDALPVAKEVAEQVGLGGNIVKFSDVKGFPENELIKSLEEHSGFAEIYPEDKYSIVKGLQQGGHIVGMTGDGVNDAPALRQAEVGVAVSNATDVAKKAASVVLTTEGLVGILDLVKTGRIIYQRIITWILNKVVKTFQIAVLVVLAFLLTGMYIISALHMILLIFLTDFVTLSLSTDNVRYSEKPDSWNITGLIKVAACLGIVIVAELLIVLGIGLHYFGLGDNINQLHTFSFELLIYVELLDMLIVRERKHFWDSRPSKPLLMIILGDLLLIFLISVFGLPGVTPINPIIALMVPAFSLTATFLVNDFIKVPLINKFWSKQ
jgi:H+-transporting ATPase